MFKKSLSNKLLLAVLVFIFFLSSAFVCIFCITTNDNSQSSSNGSEISYQAPFKTVTEGENSSVDLSIFDFTITGLTHQWYKNVTQSNSGGSVTSANQTGLAEGDHYYYIVFTFSGGISLKSKVVTEKIAENNTDINLNLINFEIESSEIGNLTHSLTYQWYRKIENSSSTSAVTAISGATSARYTTPNTSSGLYHYYVVLTVKTTDNLSGATSYVYFNSNSVAIKINPNPVFKVNEIEIVSTEVSVIDKITGEPVIKKYNSKSVNLSYFEEEEEGKSYAYQWYNNDKNDNTTGTAIKNATNAKFDTPTTLTPGTYYYYAKLTVDSEPEITSAVFTVTIKEQFESESVSLSFYFEEAVYPWLCKYQWYSNDKNNNTTGTAIKDATNATFDTPTTLTPGTYYYYVKLAVDSEPEITSSVFTVTVYAAAQKPVINDQTKSVIISNRGSQTVSVSANSPDGGELTYQWFLNGSPIIGATDSTYKLTGLIDRTGKSHYLYVQITNTKDNGNGLRTATVRSDSIEIIQSGITLDGILLIMLGCLASVAIGGFITYKIIKKVRESR